VHWSGLRSEGTRRDEPQSDWAGESSEQAPLLVSHSVGRLVAIRHAYKRNFFKPVRSEERKCIA